MKRTKASKPAFFIVSDIRCLEFIHLTGWYSKGLAMDRTLIDWVKGCGESKVVTIGFVIMLVIFGFWWFAVSTTEQSNRSTVRTMWENIISGKERRGKDHGMIPIEITPELDRSETATNSDDSK